MNPTHTHTHIQTKMSEPSEFFSSVLFGGICCLLAIVSMAIIACLRWRTMWMATKAARAASSKITPENDAEPSSRRRPPFLSIVIPTLNDAEVLETHLPRFLKQTSREPFEVIVADQGSTDATTDLIERLQTTCPHLRSTFIPDSSRFIELRKLAITLGIRAARSKWVIIVEPDSQPVSNGWVAAWERTLTDDADFVLAYSNYDSDHTSHARRMIFERLMRQARRYAAWRKGRVTGSETGNYAVRRDWFIGELGFADSLCVPFGEDSIFASLHAEAGRTLVTFSSALRLTLDLPSEREAQNRRVCDEEVRRHLSRWSRMWQRLHRFAAWSAQLLFLTIAVYAVIRIASDITLGTYSSQFILTDIVMTLLSLLGVSLSCFMAGRMAQAFDEPPFQMSLMAQVVLAPWRTLRLRMMHYARWRNFVRNYVRQTDPSASRSDI